jgi:predicted ATP-dependent endonuclease of OLD family
MLYAATYLSERGNVVLIDEPELSLHIDWQRMLLPKMAKFIGPRQIIVCTHSPEIGAEYWDRIISMAPTSSYFDRPVEEMDTDEVGSEHE